MSTVSGRCLIVNRRFFSSRSLISLTWFLSVDIDGRPGCRSSSTRSQPSWNYYTTCENFFRHNMVTESLLQNNGKSEFRVLMCFEGKKYRSSKALFEISTVFVTVDHSRSKTATRRRFKALFGVVSAQYKGISHTVRDNG